MKSEIKMILFTIIVVFVASVLVHNIVRKTRIAIEKEGLKSIVEEIWYGEE